MTETDIGRRSFLSRSAIAALGVVAAGSPRSAAGSEIGEAFQFEITRTEEEWRARLSKEEFNILRKGSTELPNTSPLVKETSNGIYCCKGCDLSLYESTWKVPLDIGWVFFQHAVPRTVLMSIDGEPPSGMGDSVVPAMIEAHCRRCGSHLGHIVIAEEKLVHCINGASLIFDRARA